MKLHAEIHETSEQTSLTIAQQLLNGLMRISAQSDTPTPSGITGIIRHLTSDKFAVVISPISPIEIKSDADASMYLQALATQDVASAELESIASLIESLKGQTCIFAQLWPKKIQMVDGEEMVNLGYLPSSAQ